MNKNKLKNRKTNSIWSLFALFADIAPEAWKLTTKVVSYALAAFVFVLTRAVDPSAEIVQTAVASLTAAHCIMPVRSAAKNRRNICRAFKIATDSPLVNIKIV